MTGKRVCLHCGEPTQPTVIFCSPYCRNVYDYNNEVAPRSERAC